MAPLAEEVARATCLLFGAPAEVQQLVTAAARTYFQEHGAARHVAEEGRQALKDDLALGPAERWGGR